MSDGGSAVGWSPDISGGGKCQCQWVVDSVLRLLVLSVKLTWTVLRGRGEAAELRVGLSDLTDVAHSR